MPTDPLQELINRLASGELTPEMLLSAVAQAGTADLGDARIDLDRRRRCGFPEVIYAPGKSTETLIAAVERLLDRGERVLATRVTAEQAAPLLAAFPAGRFHPLARTFRAEPSNDQLSPSAGKSGPKRGIPSGRVVVLTAGSSDLPVAEEARQTLDWMEVPVELIPDVGVAGPQRLLAVVPQLRDVAAVVVAAGMEGALPSVVGGHVACPVIAVPTSVGYGAAFGGLSALLTMLNSCAANVTVVNIDAGFKAGYVAGMIAWGHNRS